MIEASIYRNKNFEICGFQLNGHAGFAEEGSDIICSAVSMLVINSLNAIEKFTSEHIIICTNEEVTGHIECELPEIKAGGHNHDVELILETMLLGLNQIENEYSCYIKINDKGGRV